uniref:Uncharacterized protein n=1 Tax=Candidatus Kentrum sp. FM TaxID=2126340 RepID=A0A450SPY5_9GAMM|nr:MAG: hypothetical protein BECKFM1743A_GA0114220_100756 [Candidatus Kentron sp. FM]VFJ56023.1 MAG: hypothetical protein BECKFM1743C_GA0114222_101683 [Candidatus Kentron sp. FM]
MADRCNYLSEIDMDGRMFGGECLGANLVFAHYARFALMPKSCGYTALCYIRRSARQLQNRTIFSIGLFWALVQFNCEITH